MVMLVARCVSLTYAQMVLWMIRMLWMIITLFDLIAWQLYHVDRIACGAHADAVMYQLRWLQENRYPIKIHRGKIEENKGMTEKNRGLTEGNLGMGKENTGKIEGKHR